MEVCPGDARYFEDEVVSSAAKKRRRHGVWLLAVAQKTTYELTGDVGFSGVVISDWVSGMPKTRTWNTASCWTKSSSLNHSPWRSSQGAHQALGSAHQYRSVFKPYAEPRVTTPLEKSFSLFVVVPEGYRPDDAGKVTASVTKRAAHILHHKGEFTVDDALAPDGKALKTVRSEFLCSVRILANVPLKSAAACGGDSVQISAMDCFEVCETIGYADEGDAFELRTSP